MAEIPGSGFLRLFPFREPAGSRNLWDVPNLLLQKFPAPNFSATTRMRLTADQAGKQIGLLIMGGDYAYLSLRRADSGFALVQVVCVNAEKGGDEVVKGRVVVPGMAGHTSDYLYCRVEVRAPDAQCFFSFSLDGSSFSAIGEPFFAKPDKWIGAKLGLFCLSPQGAKNGGYADVDWFRIEAVSH
jgi:hypothetical protein